MDSKLQQTPVVTATKQKWESPRLQRIGSLAEVVKSGGGKSGVNVDGSAGTDATEFMMNK
jgi:hypothetical protein